MSVEEQIRSEMLNVGRLIDPDVASALAQVESGVRRQHTRRAIILATAATLAAVAGLVWAGGPLGWLTGQDDVQPVERPSDLDGGWVRLADPDLQDNRTLDVVIEIDGRLAAFGSGDAPILTSSDGIDWTPADTPAANLLGVVQGGPGLITYGSTPDDAAVLWTSTDGLTWTPADDPGGVFDMPGSGMLPLAGIADVTAGGPGFVAVGASDDKPTVWTSPDGLEWTLAAQLASTSGWLYDVEVVGADLVVEGAIDPDPDTSRDPEHRSAAWTSEDGTDWSRAPYEPVDYDINPDPSAAHVTLDAGPGLVAIAGEDDVPRAPQRTVLWTSVDGQSWTRVPEEQHGIDGAVSQAIEVGGQFVAVGERRGQADRYPDAAVWTSADGLTWDPVIDDSFGGPMTQGIGDIIDTEAGLVAVGGSGGDPDNQTDGWSAAVWILDRP